MNETKLRHLATVLILVGCVAVAPVFRLLLLDGQEARASFPQASDGPPQDEIDVHLELEPTQDPELKRALADLLYLYGDCPEILDDDVRSDEQCLDAVERDSMDSAAYVITGLAIVPKEGTFTYRTMFESEARDRTLVLEALSRPECRLLEGPMRLDLKETCNADAFYRYGLLTERCADARNHKTHFEPKFNWPYEGLSDYQFDLIGLPSWKFLYPAMVDVGEWHETEGWYYARRNRMRRDTLRSVWLDSRGLCPSDLLSEQLHKGDHHTLPVEIANWWSDIDRKPEHPINEIAARLGFEHLLFTMRFSGPVGSPQLSKSMSAMYPWHRPLEDAAMDDFKYRAVRIAESARGLAGMKAAGFEPDVESLVRQVCGYDSEVQQMGLEDCASAFREAEALLDGWDVEEHGMLQEIEKTAIELDLYHYKEPQ